jgi:hypothetical protein
VRTELALPTGAAANVSLEAFFAGTAGEKLQARLQASDHPLKGSKLLEAKTSVRSACGTSENLRINFSVVLTPKPLDGTAKVSADEITLVAALEDCSGK